MFCPNCGSQSKVKRFCTRCGLNLALLQYQNAQVTSREIATPRAEVTARVSYAPSLDTQSLAAGRTNPIAQRITLPEREFQPVQPMATVFAQGRSLPRYGALMVVMLAVFITTTGLWWRLSESPTVQAQSLAVAATPTAPVKTDSASPIETPQLATQAPAWVVLEDQTRGVSNAVNALAADQQMAVIEPGGQLALAMPANQFFGNGAGADIQVHGATPAVVAYRIFVRNEAAATWQRIDINRQGFPQGVASHDIGHHGVGQARQVLIQNDGPCALPIESVTAVYQNLVTNHAQPHVH